MRSSVAAVAALLMSCVLSGLLSAQDAVDLSVGANMDIYRAGG